jgi:dihydrofolate reductase
MDAEQRDITMRKIIVSNLITLDGLFAGPNGEIDWFVTGDDFFDDTPAVFERIDTMLFGRVTYEGMLSYWTSAEGIAANPDIAEQMNTTAKVVFSRTLNKVEWGKWDNARLAQGEIGAAVAKLKQETGKDMIIYGSGTIVSQLTQLGLIDEYWLFLNPLILGRGKPEFSGITRQVRLKLTGMKVFKSGVVRLMYEPA